MNFFKQVISLFAPADGSRTASPEETKGAPGFANYGGYVEEKERNPALSGRQKYVTYSDMLVNTAVVGAGVRYMLNLIAKSTWTVQPADDSDLAREYADFIDDVIRGMRTPWSRVIRRGAMYKFYGYSLQEWTAVRRDDGRIGLLDVEPRPQHTVERWDTDIFGNVRGVIQRSPQNNEEIYLPIEKLVYLVDDSLSDAPEGLGIFRHIAEVNTRLKRYEQLEGFGFETDLRGIPVARAPLMQLQQLQRNGEISAQEAASITKPIRDFVSNHIKSPKLGMVVDSSTYRNQDAAASPSANRLWDIELLRAGSTSQTQVADAINRLSHEIARIIGVEHILLGSDGAGTQALSQDKSRNFFLITDSALSEMAEAYEKSLIDKLFELNGFDIALKPTFNTEAVQFRDIEQITGALRDLAQAGAVLSPTDPAIDEIRELLGLSPSEVNNMMDLLGMGLNQNDNIQPDGETDPVVPTEV